MVERNKRKVTAAGGPESLKRRKIDVTSKKWTTISLPGDDVEGLHGLIEELSDVEVDRDDSGKISYFERSKPELESAAEEDGSTWEGFEDEVKMNVEPYQKEPYQKEPYIAPSSFAGLASHDNDSSAAADVSAWLDLKLNPDTMASLARLNFREPTPIQRAAIPEILAGHDVVGKASTGSGKTLAFGIPIVERFLEEATQQGREAENKSPLALILSPTRELAHQLSKHLTALCSSLLGSKPSIATLTGGLSMHKQQRILQHADILIGTPGRVWDIIGQGKGVMASLKEVLFLVIDEADRLLGDGHFKEVEEILGALDKVETKEDYETGTGLIGTEQQPKQRQTLVFSATFDKDLQRKLATRRKGGLHSPANTDSMAYLLSKLNFRENPPKFIDMNPVNPLVVGLKEGLVTCTGTEKDLYLYALLLLHPSSRTIVFTNSINAVRRITPLLQNLAIKALPLHSGMSQKARLQAIERFNQHSDQPDTSANAFPVLVTTDVAARGLDIPNVRLIIHYHLSRAADTYVHRSGRTARAGQSGSSIIICAPEEVAGVRKLVAQVHASSAMAKDLDASEAVKQGFYIRTLDIDRKIVSRLKERVALAKRIADASIAKEKHSKEDTWLRGAAEELGVEYDSEEFEKQAKGRGGRGSGRKAKERTARALTKAELGSLKSQLSASLRERINVGVSEKYLASGRVDVNELLRQPTVNASKTSEFLGLVNHLGLEDF